MIDSLYQSIHIFAAGCQIKGGSFFGIPTWYKYLSGVKEQGGRCTPQLTGLNDIWLIVLAVIEIMLRVAVVLAIAFIIIGGIKFITSRANPDKTNQAKNTVVDAFIGLVIAISATAAVSFIAGRFQG